jgi:hypothetical protein
VLECAGIGVDGGDTLAGSVGERIVTRATGFVPDNRCASRVRTGRPATPPSGIYRQECRGRNRALSSSANVQPSGVPESRCAHGNACGNEVMQPRGTG